MADLRLIFNGDDYGRSTSVNAAITQAHEQGVLTSASLMVTGEAFDDAVRRARAHPTLAVGLHVAVMGTRGAAPAGEVPHLLNAQGCLPGDVFLAGVRYFFSPVVRRELQREIRAQLDRFVDTGLPLAHVDGHYLLHLHPTVFSLLMPLAEQYGVPGIRLPRDDLRLTVTLNRTRLASKVAWASVYAILCRLAERHLRQGSLAYTDRVYGLLQTGRMHEPFVLGLLRRLPASVRSAELYFHPSIQEDADPYGPNPGDLAALLSPRVKQAVCDRGAELSSYAALGTGSLGRRVCPGHMSS